MAYQGTLLSIRTAVIDRLRLDATQDSDRVDEWINLAYAEAVQQTACLQQAGTAALTAGETSYAVPSAVTWIRQVVIVYSDGSVSNPLQPLSLEELLEWRRTTSTVGQNLSTPVYALAGQNRLELWPEPGSGETMKFWYVYLPDALTADGDSPLIQEPYGSKLLELGACVEGAKFKKDPLLSVYEAEYATWLARFQAWLNRRQSGYGRALRVRLSGETAWPELARDVG